MENINLASIKTCESIFSNGEDVLIRGSGFWQFRSNGEFVRKIPIRHPNRIAFLPNRRVFIDDGCQRFYHLSLETGEALWVLKEARSNRMGEFCEFAVSPEGNIVYSCFYRQERGKRRFYVELFDLDGRQHSVFPIDEGMEITADLFVDPDGSLCVLQHQYVTSYCDEGMEYPNHTIHRHGILTISFQNGTAVASWKYQWEITDGGRFSFGKACDGRYILFRDFSVLDLETKQKFFLLDEEDRRTLPTDDPVFTYDPVRFLLTVQNISRETAFERQKVIIDCSSRKIVARYVMEEPCWEQEDPFASYTVGYCGCLVGNSFWIGTPTEGIVRLPFPNSTRPVEPPTPEEEYAASNAAWWRFVRESRKLLDLN